MVTHENGLAEETSYQRRHFSTTCHVLKPSCPFPGQTEPYGTSYRLPIPLIDDAPLLFDDEHPVLGEPHRDRSRQVHPPPPLVGGRPDLSRHLARSARFVQAPFVDEVDHRSLDEGHVRPSVRRCLALQLSLLVHPGDGRGGRPPSSCSVLCPIRHFSTFSAIDETSEWVASNRRSVAGTDDHPSRNHHRVVRRNRIRQISLLTSVRADDPIRSDSKQSSWNHHRTPALRHPHAPSPL